MKLISAYNKLLSLPTRIFTTQDLSILIGVTNKQGNQLLSRLANEDLVIHLRRGLWAIKNSFDRLMLPEYLTAPFPSYISLQTALNFHGLISQIPSNIYIISIARSRSYDTPVGFYSVHHIQANLYTGFEVIGNNQIKMATKEKALFDFFYLKATKSKLFFSLPEIEIPKKFNWQQVMEYSNRVVNVSRRVMLVNLIKRYKTKK